MSTKKSDLWTHWAAAVAMVAVIATISWSDTYRVINTDDTGDGSLRWAIESANDNPGLDDIVFNIKKSGPHMIQPTFPLPELKEEVVIDGYTQPGAKYATDHSNAVLKIVLDGSLTPDTTGLSLSSATHGCSIKGLKIQQFKLAIGIDGHDNSVEGNHILDGVYEGIGIMKAYNTVGGVTPEQRNVVTGNNVAIWISPSSAHNRIQGNYIGTDADGQYDASTDGMEGVAIGGSDNTVADNVISGYEQGVTILRWSGEDPLPENNVIEGNKIGTNADGTSPIPNGLGILINTGVNTTVKGNLITRNTFSGVVV